MEDKQTHRQRRYAGLTLAVAFLIVFSMAGVAADEATDVLPVDEAANASTSPLCTYIDKVGALQAERARGLLEGDLSAADIIVDLCNEDVELPENVVEDICESMTGLLNLIGGTQAYNARAADLGCAPVPPGEIEDPCDMTECPDADALVAWIKDGGYQDMIPSSSPEEICAELALLLDESTPASRNAAAFECGPINPEEIEPCEAADCPDPMETIAEALQTVDEAREEANQILAELLDSQCLNIVGDEVAGALGDTCDANPCSTSATMLCVMAQVILLTLDAVEGSVFDAAVSGAFMAEQHEAVRNAQRLVAATTPSDDPTPRGPAAGKWSLELSNEPTEAIGSLVGGADTGVLATAFKGFEIPFEQTGDVDQPAIIYLDDWEEIPNTQRPPEDWEKEQAAKDCEEAKNIARASAAAWVVFGSWNVPGWYAGAFWTLIFFENAVATCADSAEIIADDGELHCYGESYVEWGSEASGDGETELASTLTMRSSAQFDYEPIREEFIVDIYTNAYWAGVDACNQDQIQKHEAAKERYREHNAATGDGTAETSLDLIALPGMMYDVSENAKVLAPEAAAYIDLSAGLLIVGCQEASCPMEVSLHINSGCGTGTLTPTGKGAEFAYVDASCVSVTLVVAGQEFGSALPLMYKSILDKTGTRSGGS